MRPCEKRVQPMNFLRVHRSNGKHNLIDMNMLATAQVGIGVGNADLEGLLELPHAAHGIVLFAHGSGSSRLSPRNNYVAHVLREAGVGTLLLDLLTQDEERSTALRFDIGLLAGRLRTAADWLRAQDATMALPLGLFGASTGAAAALRLAADPGVPVAAVVSRGGRPDLAGADVLRSVEAPTRLMLDEAHRAGGVGVVPALGIDRSPQCIVITRFVGVASHDQLAPVLGLQIDFCNPHWAEGNRRGVVDQPRFLWIHDRNCSAARTTTPAPTARRRSSSP